MVNKGNSPTLNWAAHTDPSGKLTYISTAVPIEYAAKMERVGAILYTRGDIPSNTKGALARYVITWFIDKYLGLL